MIDLGPSGWAPSGPVARGAGGVTVAWFWSSVMIRKTISTTILVGLTILLSGLGDVALARKSGHVHPRRAYAEHPTFYYPSQPPDCPGLPSYNPANPDRGYCDPGFAYHGNVNGCAVDLGYGRWEPCDKGGMR
jgi:hypothetical protein